MRNPEVHWFDGLFLTPHHFQASDRSWEERSTFAVRLDHGYAYGLRRGDPSEAALKNLRIEFRECAARTREGTLVGFGVGEGPPELTLRDSFGDGDRNDPTIDSGAARIARVFLAVPRLRVDRANVGEPTAEGGLCRYLDSGTLAFRDDNDPTNEQAVHYKRLHVRFLAAPVVDGRVLLPGGAEMNFELLPVAQVRRTGMHGPQLDDEYIPPLLAVDAWPPLQYGILRDLYDRIGARLEVLAEHARMSELTFATEDPVDLNRLFFLMRLNEAYATLRVVAFAEGIHPCDAYRELLRILGQLAIFEPARRGEEPPPYDHDELGPIFRWVHARLVGVLDLVGVVPFFTRPFRGQTLGLRVEFDNQWLGKDFEWFVGVHYKNCTDDECRSLLSPHQLHWKLGSARQVDELFAAGKPALTLAPLTAPPARFPRDSWVYFKVGRSGEAWKDVVLTQTLAIRYKEALVSNPGELEGKESLQIAWGTKRVDLRFVLYALPSKPLATGK